MDKGIITGLALYFIITIGISYLSTRKKIESQQDYIVGKGFGSIITGFAAASTLASGYKAIGLVAMGYVMGFLSLYQAIFAPFFDFLCWRFLAPKIKELSTKHKSMTVVDLLSSLRGDPTYMIRTCAVLCVVLFMFAYLASNIIAAGKAAVAININYNVAILFSAVLVMIYVMLGGVTAAYWAEAFQGMLMIAMFILMPAAAIIHLGGVDSLFTKLHQINPILLSGTGGRAGWPLFAALWLWMGVAMGFLGQPQGLQKFIAVESEEKLPGGSLIAVFFNSATQWSPLVLGFCCRILFPSISDPQLCTPTFIQEYFPNIIGGLMLAAVFAAIMSTNSSLLLQSTADISVNILRKGIFRKKSFSEKQYKLISQAGVLIFGLISLVIAYMETDTVFSLNQLAWAGLGSSFAPALLMGIYWRKTTHQGILSGVIAGTLITFFWYNGGKPWFGLHQGTASFLLTFVIVFLVSILTYKEKSTQINNITVES